MGKNSIKDDKTIFQLSREKAGMTRAQAAQASDYFLSDSRIEKVENQKLEIHPEEVVKMAEIYKDSELCANFCASQCAIGRKRNFEMVHIQELSQIVLEVLASLNYLENEKNRLVEMTVDGKIDEEEIEDFVKLKYRLNQIARAVNSLTLWVDDMVVKNEIDEAKLCALIEEMKNHS